MSFIPFVVEGASYLGSLAAEETGSAAVGGAVSSGIVSEAGKVVESGTKSFVDSIFGDGTFDNLEKHVSDLYGTTKTLAGDIVGIEQSVEDGNLGSDQINKLNQDTKNFQNGHIVKATTEFVKDFSHLVSTGDYNALDDPSNEIITNNTSVISGVMDTLSRVNPFYAYLVSKFGDKLTDFVIPTNEDYQKVASVYNGVGLYDQMMQLEQTFDGYEFSLIDEAGIKQVWKYPEWNTYPVIKPIWGVYTGLNSPNNALCLSGSQNGKNVESFLDKIAFLHDVGYHELGSFNITSDYQLISRAKYGKDNGLFIFPNEAAIANVACSYFATIGSLTRRLFGDNAVSQNVVNVGVNAAQVQTDSNAKEAPLIHEIVQEIHGETLTTNDVADLQQQVKDTIKSSSSMIGSETVKSTNFALVSALNNLEIILE